MLARARAAGIPVFHIMHDAGQGSPYGGRRPGDGSLLHQFQSAGFQRARVVA